MKIAILVYRLLFLIFLVFYISERKCFKLKTVHQTFSRNKLAVLTTIKPLVENIFLLSAFSHLFERLIKPLVEMFYKKLAFQTFKEL